MTAEEGGFWGIGLSLPRNHQHVVKRDWKKWPKVSESGFLRSKRCPIDHESWLYAPVTLK
jgi:hypothetical protein